MNCAEAQDLAPELALGVLSGAERAEVILHVNGCGRCQAYVAELTEAADALPLLAPEREPSAGFETRVLTEISTPVRASRRRWIGATAAVAAAAAILSITIVRVVESGDASLDGPIRTAAPVVAKMVGGETSQPAGWVAVSGGQAITVAVDYGVSAGKYRIELQRRRGDPVALGYMNIDDAGRGFWAGQSNALITGAARISLVDISGREACHGKLSTPQ